MPLLGFPKNNVMLSLTATSNVSVSPASFWWPGMPSLATMVSFEEKNSSEGNQQPLLLMHPDHKEERACMSLGSTKFPLEDLIAKHKSHSDYSSKPV